MVCLGVLLAASGGCSDGRVPTVPVSGKVTFDGGPCPGQGHISFAPIEATAGLPRRPGSATFSADGQYVVTSFQPDDGLVPGRYRVLISCFDGTPDSTKLDGFREASFISDRYQPEELTVEVSSGSIVKDFDVPLKRNRKPK